MFPGAPWVKNGYAYCNDKPGWGVDFNEELAAKYPPKGYNLTGSLSFMERRPDGTAVRTCPGTLHRLRPVISRYR